MLHNFYASNALFLQVLSFLQDAEALPPIDQLSQDELCRIAAAVREVFTRLGSGNHEHAAALTAAFLDGIAPKTVQHLTGMKPSTLHSRRADYKDDIFASPLFESRAKKGVKRERARDVQTKADVRAYLEQYAVTKSGEKDQMYRTKVSSWSSFDQYLKSGGRAGFWLFRALWEEKKIRVAKNASHDFFSCVDCQNVDGDLACYGSTLQILQEHRGCCSESEQKQRVDVLIQDVERRRLELDTHVKLVKIQRDAYLRMRETLDESTLMLTADFGVHPTQSDGGKLPNLVLVAHFRAGDEIQHIYLDCFPLGLGNVSKDWCYVKDVLLELHRSGFFQGYSRLLWWSDTGPNHFRVSSTLYFMRLFQEATGIEVLIHFFAPRHGHSRCDGHLGTIARVIAKESQALAGSDQRWDAAWVKTNIEKLAHTYTVEAEIVVEEDLVSTLVGVRNYLVFTFPRDVPNGVACHIACGAPATALTFSPK